MPNDILMGIKSIVWGLSCSLLWQCDPQPSLSTWQCNTRDGSVWKDGVIVEASRPCNWGLSEDSAPRSATCPGAETLASIEKQEVSRKNLQVVVVQHEEDISWSDPFAPVRTVCKKSGRLRGSAAPAGHQPAAWLGPAPRAHLPPRIPCAMACHPSALLPTPA